MLENRAPEWHDGKTGSVLDATDLASVEVGAAGMRAWTADETRLVEASRRAEERRKVEEQERARRLHEAEEGKRQAEIEKQKETEQRLKEQEESNRRLRKRAYALAGAFVLAVATSIVAWVERGTAQEKAREARSQTAKVLTAAGVTALEQGQSSLAMHQFAEAIKAVDEDALAQESNRLRLGMLVRDADLMKSWS